MIRRSTTWLLATLLLALAACGGGGDQLTYAAFIAGVEEAEAAGTVRMGLETTTQLPDGQVVATQGDGVVALDGTAADLTISTEVMGQALDVRTLIVDGTYYIGGGLIGQMLGGDDAFLELTLDDISAQSGFDVEQFLQAAEQAQQSFDQFRGMLEDSFEVIGEEEVDGETLTHLRGTITKERLVENSGGALEGNAILDTIPDEYVADVWVDDQNRPRRIDTGFSTRIEGQDVDVAATVTLDDYGVEVDVEAPTNTTSFAEFMEGLGGLGG